jgi:beta-glucosidase
MVERILTGVIASGLYDHPTPATAQPIDYAAHADVAQRAAEAGIVLLKNDRDVLPFAKTAKRIVLIGGHADVGVLSGGGSSQVRSVGGVPIEIPLTEGAAMSFARLTYHSSSPLRAIRAAAPGVDVRYIDGRDPTAAAAAARDADVAIVFATHWQTEAQDAPSLSLPDGQDALIAAVAKANRKSVVVLETGGAVLMPWVDDVAGIVQAWYPGQRGGEAIARVLFGDVEASGRLPLSFPRTIEQLPRPTPVLPAGATSLAASASDAGSSAPLPPAYPVTYQEGANVGYRWYAQRSDRALFPFGYGLSYTRFRFDDVRFTGGARPGATVAVTNTGKRAGVAVPQLYATGPDGSPVQLAGFQRVVLAPGQTTRVSMAADPRILARWSAGSGWAVAPGRYRLAVATDATREIAGGDVEVAGVTVPPR